MGGRGRGGQNRQKKDYVISGRPLGICRFFLRVFVFVYFNYVFFFVGFSLCFLGFHFKKDLLAFFSLEKAFVMGKGTGLNNVSHVRVSRNVSHVY